MAVQFQGDTFTAIAGADLSAYMYRIVTLDANLNVQLAPAGGGIGVLQNNPRAGESASVKWRGDAKVAAAGNVALFDKLVADVNGRATQRTAPTATGAASPYTVNAQDVLLRAHATASGQDQLVDCFILHAGI